MPSAPDGGASNDQAAAKANIIVKMMPSSLDGVAYKSTPQTQKYIVIHNTAGGTASSNVDYFHSGSDGRHVSTHYVVDDKEAYQVLENNWKGHHVGDGDGSSGITNSNSIGIEVADGSSVDHTKAVEVVIELTRYLMKQMNIDADHVVRHYDATGKQCPATIMSMTINGMNGWDYIKEQIKTRNEQNQPIELDTDKLKPGTPGSGTNTGTSGVGVSSNGTVTENGLLTGHDGYLKYYDTHTDYTNGTNAIDLIPNQDHRYNIANMDEVTGACLVFLPPYNVCPVGDRQKHMESWGWDRKYHYVIDHSYDAENDANDEPQINECTADASAGTGDDDSISDGDGDDNEVTGPGEVVDPEDGNTTPPGSDDIVTPANFFIKAAATLENTIFWGDSLTVGIGQSVSGARVYATGGHAIHQGYKAHMSEIKAATNVENIVISYGVNDAGHQQPERFKNYYIEYINELKEAHPNANIYINKIFPGDLSRATNDIVKICLENVPAHNAVLGDVIAATGAKLLDCTTFVNLNDYYQPDGIHFSSEFYKLWTNEMLRQMGYGGSNPSDPSNPGNSSTPGVSNGPTITTPIVNSPDAVEDNCIVITGGLEKIENRLLQCYGLADVDRVTYINRSLYDGHPEKHTIMIAAFIPAYDDLEKDKITYEQVEKNLINAVSKILWANGLEAKDLWREFDLNRMPSPAIYLDRDKWKDLLTEIDKLVEWRNKKFGKVATTYIPYVATISNISFGSTGGSGGDGSTGTVPDIGEISDIEQAVWTFLIGAGYSTHMAAGIMGNMKQESGVDPTRIQGNGKGPAAGICQWENYNTKSARWADMAAHAQSNGKDWTDLQSQLEFVHMELQGKAPNDNYTFTLIKKYYGSWENFSQISDIKKATDAFEDCFERAGNPMMENRYKYAQQYYDKFTQGSSIVSLTEPDILFSVKTGTLSWPCPSTKSISSRFGPRNISVGSKNHKGIDIPCPSGSDIIAAAAGKVVQVSFHEERGHYVVVDHGNGLGTLYQHLTKATVSEGQAVQANEVIAISGNTGIGTGPHLHFEVHEGFSGTRGTPVDPEKYVSPGTTNGSIPGTPDGTPGNGGGDTGTPSTGGSGSINVSSNQLVNSPVGDIVNPGPAKYLPYTGNSMGGLNHDQWGGKMIYKAGEPTDPSAVKPTIGSVLSSNEYQQFCDTFFMGETLNPDGSFEYKINFKKYWEYIDIYVADHEPYDKGLIDSTATDITNNDRLNALTTNFTSDNENTFHFNVVESGPGTTYHCVRAADELNVIARPKDLKVEPIYPDLIIPPHYSTTDYDESSPNTIPLNMIDDDVVHLDNADLNKQFAFDYNLLTGKKKETNPCSGPINFLDPYPIDDKIQELENHFPKVFIDEIESQMYSCNHPGCPIAQPMAKNFAMLQDAIMNQSKRVEQRLCRLENILSTVIRNQGRLGSRMNINCVYYGGQSVYGKYKCIRCLHDDRVHDGAIVTLDQCLNCTRYEPILGQVYQILDDTGFNASIILDDMQMSYSDLYAVQQLNMGTLRSPKYEFVENSGDKNCLKPTQTRQEMWKEANKSAYLAKKGLEYIEDKTESAKGSLGPANDIKSNEDTDVKETDYIFRMDWNDTFFNQQEADVKKYQAEGIISRYKKAGTDLDYETYLLELDPELDKDVIKDVQDEMSLVNGQWVDTREIAETAQQNKYSSEKFYFKGFAEYKLSGPLTGGIGSPGTGTPGDYTGLPSDVVASECRSKIVEMANQIVADHDAGKAKYNTPSPRTVDYTKPQSSGGKVCYDCTSFVSCCYLHAGLKSMYDKSCSGGSLVAEIVNNGGKMWLVNDAGLNEALPGDVVLKATSAVSQSQMGTQISTTHAMVYIGNGQIAHASSPSSGIKKEDLKSSFRWKDGKHFFVRPRDLMEADEKTAQENVQEETGTVDGNDYVAKISDAVVSSYYESSSNNTAPVTDGTVYAKSRAISYKGSSGLGLENGKTCASHNLPYGTKIYFPYLKELLGGDGIVVVTDTGSPVFDFDIYTNKGLGKINTDAYILSWGTGEPAPSYTWALNNCDNEQWKNIKTSWKKYKAMNGKLVNFLQYNTEDAYIKNNKRY